MKINFEYTPPTLAGRLHMTPEQIAKRDAATRKSLIAFLEKRRARLGQTSQDMMQAPETVYERQQEKLRAEQKKLVDDYMQTRESVDTL